MPQILKNNVSGVLGVALSASGTSMTLLDASGFPAPAGGDFYLLTLVGLNTNGQEASWEVVKVTAKASNTLTVERAQEGTTAAAWPVATTVQLRLTAGSVMPRGDIQAALDAKAPIAHVGAGAAAHSAATTSAAGFMSGADKTKLDGIATGATKNATDAQLRDRATHTGTQAVATVAGLQDALDAKQPLDADLTAIAALAGTAGLLKKTAANTWALDTTAYTTNLGTVTEVTGAAPVVSSGGTAPVISMPAATASVNGYMTSAYAAKLDGIAAGANAYAHPASHPPSIIAQDASNRFVTDAEKTSWNAKAAGTHLHSKSDVGLGNVDNTSDASKSVLSATKLTTARTINGVSFDGTANITVADATKEPSFAVGTTSQYFRGDKTWRDFFTDVRAATLTGLSTTTNAVISATDTVLGALGKLQKQVSDNLTTLTSHTGSTSNPHSVTKSQVGLGNVDNTSDATKAVLSAAKLTTARTIAGTSFDGQVNIDISYHNLTNKPSLGTAAAKDVPVTGNASAAQVVIGSDARLGDAREWTASEVTQAEAEEGTATTARKWTAQRVGQAAAALAPVKSVAGKTGVVSLVKGDVGLGSVDNTADSVKSVASAAKLTTARTIGGVSFDGSANINLPGVNVGGNQNTTGNAATATSLASGAAGSIPYQTAASTTAMLAKGTAGQALVMNSGATAPAWTTLGMDNIPDAAFKKSVVAATTGALTVTATSTTLTNSGTLEALVLDGVTLAVNDRVLVKNQASAAQNGIYTVTTVGSASVAWVLTRAADANTSSRISCAVVAVDKGTTLGADLWTNTFKATDTLGTTAMNWYEVLYNSGTWSISTTGNAATATKLATARTIGGVSFDGSANINLPGVNAAGNQSTTGNAATATKLATARTINGVSFDGTTNITINAVDSTAREPAIAASTTARYFRGDKTWQDMASAVRGTTLAGLDTSDDSNIAATDTVLGALGKLQGQRRSFVTRAIGVFEGPLGYAGGVGIGGIAIQPTSKTTGVTLNNLTGMIQTHNETLAPGGTKFFTFSNSHISIADALLVWCRGNAGMYHIRSEPGNGVAFIFITNSDTVARTEVVPIQFLVLKGADS